MEIDFKFVVTWILVSLVLIIIVLFATPMLKNKLIKIVSAVLAPVVAFIVLNLNRNKYS